MSADTQSWTTPPEGSVCWIETPARDLEKLKTFYTTLFPTWKPMPPAPGNTEAEVSAFTFASPKGLGGSINKMPEDAGPHSQAVGSGSTVYYFVDSLEKTEARVHELGGKTVKGKTPQSTMGWFMNMTDPEGNIFGIYQIAKGSTS